MALLHESVNYNKEGVQIMGLKITQKSISEDGSIKYIFTTSEKNLVEGIYFRIPGKENFSDNIYHLCISSQAGCAMGCTFCATGYGGFFSQLSAEEIIDQVDLIYNDLILNEIELQKTGFSVNLMGMGEALMNYENIKDFCYLAPSKYDNLQRVCISTVGITPRIRELAAIAKDVSILRLFVSIHSPYDQERTSIMPITKKYSIESVLAASQDFYDQTFFKVTLSYLLLEGVNNSTKHAEDFAKLIAYKPGFVVQLLLYNETPKIPFMRPSYESAVVFKEILSSYGIETIIQISKGIDIEGGCGQLVKKINYNVLKRRKNIIAFQTKK